MIGDNTISIIIPAYNEEAYLGETLESLNFHWIDQIIVVNDGSKDKTEQIASKYPVDLISLAKNKGKGYAINQGLLKSKGDILVILDADLGKSIIEFEKLIIPLIEKEEIDFTIAIIPILGGGLGIVRKIADLSIKFICKKEMKAPLSGQRAFKRKVLEDIYPLQDGFGLEMGINMTILNHNIGFLEIECDFKHRVTGQSLGSYLHRAGQCKDIIKTLWEMKKNNYV